MSPDRDPTRGQLDIPLVWETDARSAPSQRPSTSEPAPVAPERLEPPSIGRLMLASLADLGCTLLALAAAWAAAVAAGASGHVGQLLAIAGLGLQLSAVVSCGSLWGWRGTPGMLLLDVVFARPLPARVVPRVWFGWLAFLPLAGLPLVIGRAGRRGLERLAGASVSQRRLPAGA